MKRLGFLSLLARANEERAPDFQCGGIRDWSPAECGNELAGETGELCNELKKLLRFDKRYQLRDSDPETILVLGLREERRQILARIRMELGDVVICASLIACMFDIDLEQVMVDKFNATSNKIGSTVKLP